MIQIGEKNKLQVERITSVGMFLHDGEGNEVLLPNKYIPRGLGVNDFIEVFIYKDSEDRIIATTLEPLIQVNQFAFLRVVDVSPVGAFMEWGLEKDLLVPFKEQKAKMEVGKKYVVYLYLDKETDRLAASNKINKFLSNEDSGLKVGQEVALLIYTKTDLGYKTIINGKHDGLIYTNEVFKHVQLGDSLKGYIKAIRNDDKIDVSLQKPGIQNIVSSTQHILNYLIKNKGVLQLTDKSSPLEIAEKLSMSKKAFKASIGILYKQKLVKLEEDGVHLIS